VVLRKRGGWAIEEGCQKRLFTDRGKKKKKCRAQERKVRVRYYGKKKPRPGGEGRHPPKKTSILRFLCGAWAFNNSICQPSGEEHAVRKKREKKDSMTMY